LTEEIIMKSTNRSSLVFATAALLASAWVPSAFADAVVRSETVKFHDLDVNTPAGAQTLYTRLHGAAMRVCEETDPVMRARATVCARNSEANAIQKLNLPQLTAYYRGKTGNQSQPLIAGR
jgi:UrcA family protein